MSTCPAASCILGWTLQLVAENLRDHPSQQLPLASTLAVAWYSLLTSYLSGQAKIKIKVWIFRCCFPNLVDCSLEHEMLFCYCLSGYTAWAAEAACQTSPPSPGTLSYVPTEQTHTPICQGNQWSLLCLERICHILPIYISHKWLRDCDLLHF